MINKEKCSAKEKRRKRSNKISNVIKLRFSFKKKKRERKGKSPCLELVQINSVAGFLSKSLGEENQYKKKSELN